MISPSIHPPAHATIRASPHPKPRSHSMGLCCSVQPRSLDPPVSGAKGSQRGHRGLMTRYCSVGTTGLSAPTLLAETPPAPLATCIRTPANGGAGRAGLPDPNTPGSRSRAGCAAQHPRVNKEPPGLGVVAGRGSPSGSTPGRAEGKVPALLSASAARVPGPAPPARPRSPARPGPRAAPAPPAPRRRRRSRPGSASRAGGRAGKGGAGGRGSPWGAARERRGERGRGRCRGTRAPPRAVPLGAGGSGRGERGAPPAPR